jgi:ferredoxin-thioredoxin reductase catalytic subunit
MESNKVTVSFTEADYQKVMAVLIESNIPFSCTVEAGQPAHNRQITPCPCCGDPWDMYRNNACQCGAVLKQSGTA